MFFRRGNVSAEDDDVFLSDEDWKDRVEIQCEILKCLQVILTSVGLSFFIDKSSYRFADSSYVFVPLRSNAAFFAS